MKTFFAYEKNQMGRLQPVKFYGNVIGRSSGGHETQKTQVVELSDYESELTVSALMKRYPQPEN